MALYQATCAFSLTLTLYKLLHIIYPAYMYIVPLYNVILIPMYMYLYVYMYVLSLVPLYLLVFVRIFPLQRLRCCLTSKLG